jgi:hypothetical protein
MRSESPALARAATTRPPACLTRLAPRRAAAGLAGRPLRALTTGTSFMRFIFTPARVPTLSFNAPE